MAVAKATVSANIASKTTSHPQQPSSYSKIKPKSGFNKELCILSHTTSNSSLGAKSGYWTGVACTCNTCKLSEHFKGGVTTLKKRASGRLLFINHLHKSRIRLTCPKPPTHSLLPRVLCIPLYLHTSFSDALRNTLSRRYSK